MNSPETRFIQDFTCAVYAHQKNAFCEKIPDGFRTGLKPFDFILDTGWRIYFLEFKVLPANRRSFKPKSIFKPHQIRELNKIALLHLSVGTLNPAWAVVKRGRDVFMFHPRELLNERIILNKYRSHSIKTTSKLLCSMN